MLSAQAKVNDYDASRVADAIFDECDRDGSGSVDRAEFAEWAAASPLFRAFLKTHALVFGGL